jgi:hypothetical protein
MAHEELSVDGLQNIHEACLVGTIWRNNDLTGIRRLLQGGGRSSARETIGRVAAGAVAKKLLQLQSGTEVLAYVSSVHGVSLPEGAVNHDTLTMQQVTQF